MSLGLPSSLFFLFLGAAALGVSACTAAIDPNDAVGSESAAAATCLPTDLSADRGLSADVRAALSPELADASFGASVPGVLQVDPVADHLGQERVMTVLGAYAGYYPLGPSPVSAEFAGGAANGLFDAMTRAVETTEDGVVVRRSARGHTSCRKQPSPTVGATPIFFCSIGGVVTMVPSSGSTEVWTQNGVLADLARAVDPALGLEIPGGLSGFIGKGIERFTMSRHIAVQVPLEFDGPNQMSAILSGRREPIASEAAAAQRLFDALTRADESTNAATGVVTRVTRGGRRCSREAIDTMTGTALDYRCEITNVRRFDVDSCVP